MSGIKEWKRPPPNSKWTITPEVATDLGEISLTLSEKSYQFSQLYNSNRPVTLEDINNMYGMIGCAEQIYRMTRMFNLEKKNTLIKSRIASIRYRIRCSIAHNPSQFPEAILDDLNILMDDFYEWWQQTGTYFYSENSTGKAGGAFG